MQYYAEPLKHLRVKTPCKNRYVYLGYFAFNHQIQTESIYIFPESQWEKSRSMWLLLCYCCDVCFPPMMSVSASAKCRLSSKCQPDIGCQLPRGHFFRLGEQNWQRSYISHQRLFTMYICTQKAGCSLANMEIYANEVSIARQPGN